MKTSHIVRSTAEKLSVGLFAGVVTWLWTTSASAQFSLPEDLPPWMDMAVDYGVKIIGAIFAFIVARIVAGWFGRLVFRGLTARKFDATLTRFFSNIARYAVLVFAVLGILGIFGIQTASFAAVIAAAGLAVGLAFQGTLSNFAAGIMLLVFRPFRVGDVIVAADEMGKVEEIELFTVCLITPDNRKITVPNSAIFGAKIENLTMLGTRRVDVAVGTEYSADIDQTRKVLETAAGAVPGILKDPAPAVFLAGLGASSVDWQLRVWCNAADYWDVHQAAIRGAKKALDDAKIGIPFPQMDLHVDDSVVQAVATGKRAA